MENTFLDLPDELILHVVKLLFLHDRRNMRLVAKRIDHLISPILFETLSSLEPTMRTPEPYALLSEYISRGQELVFGRCTKKMILSASGDYPFDREFPWLRLLNKFVPTLTNLHSLRWSYWPQKRPVSHLVMDAFNLFGSLPNLKELTITAGYTVPFPGFNLKSFSNLSSVSIKWKHIVNINQDFTKDVADLLRRCPNLERLTFRIPRPCHPPDAPLLAHIFANLPNTTRLKLRKLNVAGLCVSADDFRVHLHHLPSLKVLRLMFNRHADPPLQNGQICQLLLNNSIYLDELRIDTTHPTSVLDYLSSYSGLEYLEFHSRYPGADTPEGMRRFFSVVLPLHSATLRELHLGWSVETPWTKELSSNDLAQIAKCQQLTTLCSFVTVTVGPNGRTDRMLVSSDICSFSQLLFTTGAKRMWVDTAMKLPRLQLLILCTTCRYQPPLRAGQFYFDFDGVQEEEFEDAILGYAQAAVKKMTANLVVPFKVSVDSPCMGP